MLFGQVTKPTSGFVSRHLNARVSIPISKLLIDTGISPHLVTVLLVLTTGLASAWLLAHGDSYPRLALAGFLWQMAAVLDRCDGEIARVKLCESKFGAWFDTVTDNLAYLCGYVGLLLGIQRAHPGEPLYTGFWLSAAGALLLTLATLYAYARRSGSGSLQHYLRDLAKELPDSEKGWIQRAMQRYGFVAKRDFLSFVLFLAMLANSLDAVYWILVTLLHASAGAVVLSQGKMLQRTRALALRREAPVAAEEPR
jgi:phosphatidylglycerophosphate synthase